VTSSTEALIARFIREEILDAETDAVGPDDNLLVSGLIDSVGVVRLIAHVSDRLGVDVPPTDLVPANFRTIRVMASYLDGLRQTRSG